MLCECKKGYFPGAKYTCNICDKFCSACDDAITCTECKSGLNRVVKNAKCVCDDGLYESQKDLSCQRCLSTCKTCVDNKSCSSCDEITRTLVNSQCECKSDYFKNPKNECISCKSKEAMTVESCNYADCTDGVWTQGEECDDGKDSPGMVALCAKETQTIIVLTKYCNPPSVISARKIVYSVV